MEYMTDNKYFNIILGHVIHVSR